MLEKDIVNFFLTVLLLQHELAWIGIGKAQAWWTPSSLQSIIAIYLHNFILDTKWKAF